KKLQAFLNSMLHFMVEDRGYIALMITSEWAKKHKPGIMTHAAKLEELVIESVKIAQQQGELLGSWNYSDVQIVIQMLVGLAVSLPAEQVYEQAQRPMELM